MVLKKQLWEILVCYDRALVPELDDYLKQKEITLAKLIKLHTMPIYTIYFIGFLPGFLYLGGLDERLFLARKPKPRLVIPKGSVAIVGKQTGVYPNESPGGWHAIGRSPISFFDVSKVNPCRYSPGDCIRFVSVKFD